MLGFIGFNASKHSCPIRCFRHQDGGFKASHYLGTHHIISDTVPVCAFIINTSLLWFLVHFLFFLTIAIFSGMSQLEAENFNLPKVPFDPSNILSSKYIIEIMVLDSSDKSFEGSTSDLSFLECSSFSG